MCFLFLYFILYSFLFLLLETSESSNGNQIFSQFMSPILMNLYQKYCFFLNVLCFCGSFLLSCVFYWYWFASLYVVSIDYRTTEHRSLGERNKPFFSALMLRRQLNWLIWFLLCVNTSIQAYGIAAGMSDVSFFLSSFIYSSVRIYMLQFNRHLSGSICSWVSSKNHRFCSCGPKNCCRKVNCSRQNSG